MQLHQPLGLGLTSRMTVGFQKLYCVFFFSSQILRQEVDRRQLETSEHLAPSSCDHQDCTCWRDYPKSLFPNWTLAQVKKSKISIAINDYRRDVACIIYYVDVDDTGRFRDAGKYIATESTIKQSWDKIVESQVSAVNFIFLQLRVDSLLHRPPITFECERSLLRTYLDQSYRCWARSKLLHYLKVMPI